jgi:hypothetical protein
MIARHNRLSVSYQRTLDELVIVRIIGDHVDIASDINTFRDTPNIIENSPYVVLREAKRLTQLLRQFGHHLNAVHVLDRLSSCQEQALVGLATPKQARYPNIRVEDDPLWHC